MDEQTQFYYSIYPSVIKALKAEKVPIEWDPIVASQMMIETSWGKSPSYSIVYDAERYLKGDLP